tara:strand:+ start:1473 stop:1823 length:351 start_codon:yes stop_codon:yes gene_type:complete
VSFVLYTQRKVNGEESAFIHGTKILRLMLCIPKKERENEGIADTLAFMGISPFFEFLTKAFPVTFTFLEDCGVTSFGISMELDIKTFLGRSCGSMKTLRLLSSLKHFLDLTLRTFP